MKTWVLFLFAATSSALAFGQEIEKNLKHFTRVVASPRVNVVLIQGEHESIRIRYENLQPGSINAKVTGNTLRIYLNDARKIEPTARAEHRHGSRESLYNGASVTAYVTYRDLERVEIRGNQALTCESLIDTEKFTLCAYGENEITLKSVKAEYFKAKMYGENRLRIASGRTTEQKYLLYGENKIDTERMRSDYSFTRIFGEGSIRINSSDEVLIDAFGEPRIYVDGGAVINRRFVIGTPVIEN
jgi:hypothetical protein